LFHLVVWEDLYRHSLLSNPIDLSIKYLKWNKVCGSLTSVFFDDWFIVFNTTSSNVFFDDWFIVFNTTSSNVFFDVTLFLKTNVTSSERVQIIKYIWLHQLSYLRLWCLTSLSTIFQLYVVVSLIGGGNRSTGENHRPVVSHWQTLPHNGVSITPRHERDSN
jgi:hypothetical protein